MSTSSARIIANRKNALLSTGPKTVEGKEQSRRNSLKHGMTGAGVVLPEGDAAEVARRSVTFATELNVTNNLGTTLARRVALNSVRMERGADQETAALSRRVRQVLADFQPPEGADADEVDRLRDEAARIAMFDPSKEAALARKYEAAAERGFFRALKELRLLQKQSQAASNGIVDETLRKTLGSFSKFNKQCDKFEAKYLEPDPQPARKASSRLEFFDIPPVNAAYDVPFAIGRPR